VRVLIAHASIRKHVGEQAVRRTNLRPWSQGDDNGLCGLFATVNAVRWLWPEVRQKNEHEEEEVAALPIHLVHDRLSAEQFQALYLDGDELPLISQLLHWTAEWLQSKGHDARLTFPFEAAPPANKKTYWTRLLPLIEPRSAVAVVGFNDPYPHWTVATNKAGPFSVRLFDSDVFTTVDMRRTVIGTTDGRTWEIDPTAVIIMERIT
jgi:hypothetical protein